VGVVEGHVAQRAQLVESDVEVLDGLAGAVHHLRQIGERDQIPSLAAGILLAKCWREAVVEALQRAAEAESTGSSVALR